MEKKWQCTFTVLDKSRLRNDAENYKIQLNVKIRSICDTLETSCEKN